MLPTNAPKTGAKASKRAISFVQSSRLALLIGFCLLAFSALPASSQTFRFIIRAEPEIIPANGVSTTSIFVQVQNSGDFNLSPSAVVRFVTTRGVIESQAQLVGGIARVRLRSTNTPGRALVTALIGNAREEVAVDFSSDIGEVARFLEIAGPYVDYNSEKGLVSTSGPSSLDFGDLHIQGDVRMVADLFSERVWVEGTNGGVLIRRGQGPNAPTLRGDRLFYQLRQLQGVMRRVESVDGPLRQEFQGYNFAPFEDEKTADKEATKKTGAMDKSSTAPSTLAVDGMAARRSLEESVAARDGIALSKSNDDDALPLLKSDGENKTSTASPSSTAAQGSTQRAAIWLAANNETPRAAMVRIEPKIENEGDSQNKPSSDIPLTATEDDEKTPDIPLAASEGDENALVESLPAEPLQGEPPGVPGLSTTEPPVLGVAPDSTYQPIQPVAPAELRTERLTAPDLPELDRERGYWITARRIRVFPQDKIQFDHSTIFFNGTKLFSLPLYVLSLSGGANPVAGLVGFNTSGGLSLNFPYYYMASPHGTGAIYLQHAPGNGFAAEKAGFALAIEQQYFLSRRSYGTFNIDQIGRGAFNVNWQHNLQLSPTVSSRFFVNAPRHRDLYTYATVVKDFPTLQFGVEGSYGRPESGDNSALGQVFARLRPRALGKSGWNYTVSANALARRFNQFSLIPGGAGGGGIGLPGQSRPGTPSLQTTSSTLFGQTLNLSMQSPDYRPWKGANLQASVLGTAFNYSDGRRGAAPGILLGLRQKLGKSAALQLDYNFDKGGAGLYSADFTHYLSGGASFAIGNKISGSTFFSKSFNSAALYGTAGLDYYFRPKWRLGLFSDYSSFNSTDDLLNYGFSLGRTVGQREVTLNWDRDRGRFYVELGGFRL